MRPTFRLAVVLSFLAALGGGPAAAQFAPPPADDLANAVSRIQIDNFGLVGPGYLRGAQPAGRDYTDLATSGVRTVIDLQADGDNADEPALVEAAGMRFYRIPMTQHIPPTSDQIEQFLAIVSDPQQQPVYVHCKGGRHRTGVMTAIYRMERDGWSADDAYREMKQYHFGWALLHREFKNFVLGYKPVNAGIAQGELATEPIS